jgi:hypothetical protein
MKIATSLKIIGWAGVAYSAFSLVTILCMALVSLNSKGR